jgi:hypothetical protein
MFLRKAFEGWLGAKYGGKTARDKMKKALIRMTRFCLSKTFEARD